MRKNQLPEWLLELQLLGFDAEDDEDDDDDVEDPDPQDDDEDDDEDEEDPPTREELNRIKEALKKERKLRRDAEKAARAAKTKTPKPPAKPKPKAEDGSEGSEEESEEVKALREQLESGQRVQEALAKRLRDDAVNALILKYAGKFIDPEDAVRLVNRDEIHVDQDEEDPADIQVDEDSVKDAVKALSRKSKHLIKPRGSDDGSVGTPPFGGGRQKKSSAAQDELDKSIYPMLR